MVPASIDNDIPGTEISIGVDTALNVIVGCIDKLIDTSSAVNRVFIVETMGRNCGYLAVFGALASGAEQVFIPERPINNTAIEELLKDLQQEYGQGRRHAVIVVGEGAAMRTSPTDYIENYILVGREETQTQTEAIPWDVRKSVFGHLQRGGPTSAFDRILATRMGAKAVDILAHSDDDDSPQMVALKGGAIEAIPVEKVIKKLEEGKAATSQERLREIAELARELSHLPKESDLQGSIAILTGGADAQGMNMILRGASRYARNNGKMELRWEVVGAVRSRPFQSQEGIFRSDFKRRNKKKLPTTCGKIKRIRSALTTWFLRKSRIHGDLQGKVVLPLFM